VGGRGTVGDAVLAILAEHGPLELGELARLAAERGATRAKRPEVSVRQAVDREPRVVPLLDGRLVSVPAMLDGAVLTHRLDQDEADGELLPLDPDLASLAPLTLRSLPLDLGGALSNARRGIFTGRLAGSAASRRGSWSRCGCVGVSSRSARWRCRSGWKISACAGLWR
jgi:hypothetical protein